MSTHKIEKKVKTLPRLKKHLILATMGGNEDRLFYDTLFKQHIEDQVKELIANKLEITEAIRITDITRLGKIKARSINC